MDLRISRACGRKNPIDRNIIVFNLYDRDQPETAENCDYMKRARDGGYEKEYIKNRKILFGLAAGYKILVFANVHRDGKIGFEFDNEYHYDLEFLKLIMKKAKAAARRVVWTPQEIKAC